MRLRNVHHVKGRRRFFKKAAIIGAAFFFGRSGSHPAKARTPGATPAPHTRARYRQTAHIRKYYQRASF